MGLILFFVPYIRRIKIYLFFRKYNFRFLKKLIIFWIGMAKVFPKAVPRNYFPKRNYFLKFFSKMIFQNISVKWMSQSGYILNLFPKVISQNYFPKRLPKIAAPRLLPKAAPQSCVLKLIPKIADLWNYYLKGQSCYCSPKLFSGCPKAAML